jgi:amino acid adenylation domain-containing protein
MSSFTRLIAEFPLHKDCTSKLSVIAPKGFIEFKKEDIEQSIAKRFEQQVNKNPNAIAIKSKSEKFSYNQLNQAANRLAHAILSQPKQENEAKTIALFLEKGASYIAAILGVLKTGKIFVPLDSTFPQTRLSYILEDSQTFLIVTNNQNLTKARELAVCGCLVLNIDEINADISTENPDIQICADSPAYVIYTSGSTGNPKGVLHNHRNTLHYCMNDTNTLCISPNDRVIFLYSCSAMGGLLCIFYTLLNGASLYSLNIKEEGFNNLVNWLLSEKITIYHSFATLFRHFVDTLTGIEQFSQLRLIKLGGEATVRKDVELYKKYFPSSCVLCASLGTSETATFRNFIVNKNTKIDSSTVPIGYPVQDMEVLLLNEAGVEVDCGEVGEIAVKSKYLALGYWRNPELTKAVFQSDSTEKSDRIYRTGDLGRIEPDGCLVHMGRKDFQVKIRGFRIEVTEIEMVLLDTATIKEVAVMAREDIGEDKRLVAYIVPNQKKIPNITELRSFIKDKLPEYMVPSIFVFLEALPLTPNGKVNRRALPVPDLTQKEAIAIFVAPRDDLECRMTQIWEEILGIQPIGVKDNFFDLGGHSLLAARLFAEIEKQFGKQIPLAILFKSATVEALANILRPTQDLLDGKEISISSDKTLTNHKLIDPWSSLVEIQPNGSKPPFFCIHPLGGEILCYRNLAMHLAPEQPVYGLQPQGLDGKQPPYTQVEDLACHYIKQIQTLQPNGPYYLGGYSFGGVVAYEMAQQLHRQGEKVGILVMFDTARPGFSERSPFLQRIPIHLNNIFRLGPAYLQQNFGAWKEWGKYKLKHKYKSVLNVERLLAKKSNHLAVIEANAQALSEYIFQVYPGQMTLLRTQDENRKKAVGIKYDPQFGWGDLVAGGLDIHYVPGSHLSLLEEPHVGMVAERLQVCLQKAYTSLDFGL